MSEKVVCPLKNIITKNDSGYFYCSGPALPGYTFDSMCDSVFSVSDGTVTKTKMFSSKLFMITIARDSKTTLRYFSLRCVNVKAGDSIKQGEFIGLLNGNRIKPFSLLLMIEENNKFIPTEKYIRLFKNCEQSYSLQQAQQCSIANPAVAWSPDQRHRMGLRFPLVRRPDEAF